MKQKGLSGSDWLRLVGLALAGIVKVLSWASRTPSGRTGSSTQRRSPRTASPAKPRTTRNREWSAAATERCRSAKERQQSEAEAARKRELDELRAKAGQKPPIEDEIDRTPYLDDADIARQRRARLRYDKLQQDGMPD